MGDSCQTHPSSPRRGGSTRRPGACRAMFMLLAAMSLPVVGFGALGEPADALTLDDALDLAQEQNPDLLAARQELEVARGRLVTAEFANRFNPTIRGRGFNRDFADGGSGRQMQILLSQEVEVAGQRGLRIEEAKRNLSMVQAVVQDRERVLMGTVKRAFYQALVWRERVRLLRTIETFNRRVRDAASQRFRAGASPVMEANLAEIRYGQARKDTLTAEAQYQGALYELRRVLGKPGDHPIEPKGELRGRPKSVQLHTLVARAIQERPDRVAANRSLERVEAETALTKRLVLPNPTFQAIYQTEVEKAETGADVIIGGGISIPLPLFDRNQGDLVALGGRQRQARHQVTATEQRIEQEVSVAFREYEAASRALEVFRQTVLDKVEENLRFIEIAYREGKIGLLQFIVVQDDLIRAQLSYLDSLGEFRLTEANLEQASGGTL